MASRSSRNWLGETYNGTKRGRAAYGDIDWSLFPEKLEKTDIDEDPEQLHNEWRSVLKNTDVEAPGFAYEEPRRNTFARSHLNLRDGGFFGATTDPWVTYKGGYNNIESLGDTSEPFDTQFHDHDPRGFLTEQPWNEYRRLQEANMRRIDFKDDGDYSTTSGGIHPNTQYQNIRSAQNWVKARLKIFDTSFENRHVGGVGIYPHVSDVFKSSHEDTSVIDDGNMAMTWEDPENRQRLTMHLSNIVHGGSRMWRTESTTDHKVKVASYGKLYKQRGLINHENQLRLLEDDTPWSKVEGVKRTPKNLVKLMSTALQDQMGPLSDKTASQSARLMYQNSALEGHGEEQFKGMKNEESELTNDKRSRKLTKDIMALLGFVEQDVKFLESRATGKQGKQAKKALANLYKMGEVLHSLPANVKLELRNELILKSSGSGLIPGNYKKQRHQVVVNPKIVQHMDLMVRKSEKFSDPIMNRDATVADPEDILSKRNHLNNPLFVFKSAHKETEDIDFNRRQAESTDSNHRKSKGATTGTAANYKNLAKTAEQLAKNRRKAGNTQVQGDADPNLVYKTKNVGDIDNFETMKKALIDNQFGENKFINRRIGTNMADKLRARHHQETEDWSINDPVSQREQMLRKNGKNLVRSQRV